jgi:WD40 repeat protein
MRPGLVFACLLHSCAIAAEPRTDALGDPLPDGAVARFGSSRLRHPGAVEAIAYSPDGKWLASAGRNDARVRFWDARSGRRVRLIGDGKSTIRCLAFSPDSKTLAGGGEDGRLRLWDVDSGKELFRLDSLYEGERHNAEQARPFGGSISGATSAIAFSPDGKILAQLGHHPGTLWTIDGGKRLTRLEAKGHGPHFVIFTPDGRDLITADNAKGIQVWDPKTGKPRHGFEVEGPPRHANIFSLAAAPDSKHIALKLLEHIVVVELASQKVVWRQKMPGHQDLPVAFSRDSLLAFGGTQAVHIWDWQANKQLAEITEGGEQYFRRVAFASDGKRLAWGGFDGNIRIYDIAASKEALPQVGHRGGIELFAMREDGNKFATIDAAKTLRIWDAGKGDILNSRHLTDFPHPACMAFPRDGKTIVLGDSWSHVAVYDFDRESKPVITTGPEKDRYVRTFSPDGEVALATEPYSLVTHFVNSRGQTWTKYAGPELRSYDARFAADGKHVFVSGWDYLAYLDTTTGNQLWRVVAQCNPNFMRGSLAVSADGRHVVAGCAVERDMKEGSCLRILHAGSGRVWKSPRSPQFCVTAAAFSPCGRILAAASRENVSMFGDKLTGNTEYFITVWEVATGGEIARFTGHEAPVEHLNFSRDGKTFYSASADGTLLEWDWLRVGRSTKSPPIGDEAWRALAVEDAATAFRAASRLAASPDAAIALLKERLKPLKPVSSERVNQLLVDLDSDNFKLRDAATRELSDLGEEVMPALTEALRSAPSAEAETRLRALMKEREASPYPSDELRRQRAVLILEQIGSPEAKRLLRELAGGAAVTHVRQAREALGRLEK